MTKSAGTSGGGRGERMEPRISCRHVWKIFGPSPEKFFRAHGGAPASEAFAGSGYINHPDHRNAGLVALEAIFPASDNMMFFPEMLDEGFMPHKIQQLYIANFDQGNLRVDVSDAIDTKIDAILCHKTQFVNREKQAMRRWMERWGDENEDGTRTYWEYFQVMEFQPRRTDEEEENENGAEPEDES